MKKENKKQKKESIKTPKIIPLRERRSHESTNNNTMHDYVFLLEQYKAVVDESNIVSKTDKKGIITYVNKKFIEISGYSESELIGKNHNIIRHPDMPSEAFEGLWDTIENKQSWNGIIKNRKKNGGHYIVDSTVIPLINSNGEVYEFIAIRKDITELIEQSKQIKRQTTDNLTGLPNYTKLAEKDDEEGNKTAILFNIDLFREISDFYGESISNSVIQQVADIMREVQSKLAKGYQLYKMFGDEYVLYKKESTPKKELDDLLHKVYEYLHNQSLVSIGKIDIYYSMSIGAYTGNEKSAINKSKIALKYARQTKRLMYIYNENLQTEQRDNLNSIKILKKAIAQNNIIPYYQPILNNQTGKIEKYEGLARIIDSENKINSPTEFLKAAKKSRLYPYITKAMVENIVDIAKKKPYDFSINLSVEDIVNDKNREMILNAVSDFKPNNNNTIIFEITESENIENFGSVKEFIYEAKALGCKIAIDDFGSGYSNFEYLAELSVDYIKIDGSLIKTIDKDRNLQIIVRTIISFAREMGIKTVAEYIHSESVYNKVKELGFEYSQGYFIGKPKSSVD